MRTSHSQALACATLLLSFVLAGASKMGRSEPVIAETPIKPAEVPKQLPSPSALGNLRYWERKFEEGVNPANFAVRAWIKPHGDAKHPVLEIEAANIRDQPAFFSYQGPLWIYNVWVTCRGKSRFKAAVADLAYAVTSNGKITTMAPKESFRSEVELDRWFDLSGPGPFEISVSMKAQSGYYRRFSKSGKREPSTPPKHPQPPNGTPVTFTWAPDEK